ncbi:MAG TPA: hypothetical protein VIH57_22595, partial [Bacteroidales bacterium]
MNYQLKHVVAYLSYCLRRPHLNGHGIHSPFLFDFVINVVYKEPFVDINLERIDKLRRDLRNSKETVTVEDFGAGSYQNLGIQRKISEIVRFSSVSNKYGQLLYRIANYFKPELTIELGTCLGLGTMHLAAGCPNSRVISIEGAKALCEKANENFKHLKIENAISRCGHFDDLLPDILKEN